MLGKDERGGRRKHFVSAHVNWPRHALQSRASASCTQTQDNWTTEGCTSVVVTTEGHTSVVVTTEGCTSVEVTTEGRTSVVVTTEGRTSAVVGSQVPGPILEELS